MNVQAHRLFLATILVTSSVVLVGSSVSAQTCDLVRGHGKSKVKVVLGRAYPQCVAPNTTTSPPLLVPACSPPAPAASVWAFDSQKTKVQVLLKPTKDGDYDIKLKISGLVDSSDLKTPASGTGTLVLTIRLTMNDPVKGYLTTVPFDVAASVTVLDGKANLATTLNTMIAQAAGDVAGGTGCWVANLDGIHLVDPNSGMSAEATPLFSERSGDAFAGRG